MSIQQAMEHALALSAELRHAERQPLPEYHNAYVSLLSNAHRQAMQCAEEIAEELASLSMKGLDE